MKKMTLLVFVLALCLGLSSTLYAEMTKEGTAEYQAAHSSTLTVLGMEKKHVQVNFEGYGVVVDAPENCPLHKASFRVLGSSQMTKGVSKGSGFLVWTRLNGDKIYGTFEVTGKAGGAHKGVVSLVGGTGSCAEITGSINFTPTRVHPSAKGTTQTIIQAKIQWKIP